MYQRTLTSHLRTSLNDTPIILLNGARQTGKSTLARELVDDRKGQYFTFDDLPTLSAAQHDPQGFIANLSNFTVIDEIQRAPELFLPIKAKIDKDRHPGQFLLTGSANVFLLPHLADSLAGRMAIHTLWPLSQGELLNKEETFIDHLFVGKIPVGKNMPLKQEALMNKVLLGGYPEPLSRHEASRRHEWFQNYICTVMHREIKDLANIEGLKELPHLLNLLATRMGSLLNYSELSRSMSMPQTTLKRYLTLLEAIFLTYSLPPWSRNFNKRFIKSPKIYLNDTGLASYLLGIDAHRLHTDKNLYGHLLENFVINEIQKQSGWNKIPVKLFHYRTYTQEEVDVILEDFKGHLIGIEIKARATVSASDFKMLTQLKAENKNFLRGIVLYTGEQIIPFGKDLFAVPVNALWENF